MKTGEQERPLEIDFDGVHAAMLRAAMRAHQEAARTGTDIIRVIDGKVVRVKPDQPVPNPPASPTR